MREMKAPHQRDKSGPLRGYKVIDLTLALMGPYCTQILADLGADVIKIESFEGDTTRYLPPSRDDPERGGMFMNIARGKRSMAIDLKRPAGRLALDRLLKTADVLVHSMRPGAISRLGLAYGDLAEQHPRLVYASLCGFSREGPYRDLPAYDDVIQGACGLAALQAEVSGGEPAYLPTVVADKVTALTGVYAIMAALLEREKSGRGQEVEVPMFETMASFLWVEHGTGAVFDPPLGRPLYGRVISPDRRPYRTQDGYLAIMIYNDGQWRRFFSALGDPEWSRDPRFETLATRTENVDYVLSKLSEAIATRGTADWLEILRRSDIPVMRINTMDDLLIDPHLQQIGFWQRVSDQDGDLKLAGVPTRFSRTPAGVGGAAPALGAHTYELLRQHGYTAAEIDSLVAGDAVRVPGSRPTGKERL